MEPSNMPAKHAGTDAVMPSGFHGQHRSDDGKHMPRSVWRPGVVRVLADYIRQLREVDDESNQRAVARQPGESAQSEQPGQPHVCTRNPHRTCNCDAGVCADDSATYRYARGPYRAVPIDEHNRVPSPKPNHLGNFRCPITGQLCSANVCREWCEGSGSSSTTDTHRSDATAAKHS